MEHTLKRLIQKRLHEEQEKKYEKELKLQKDSYAAFLRIYEAGSDGTMAEVMFGKHGQTMIICQDLLREDVWNGQADYLLFAAEGGKLSVRHLPEMEEYFQKHPKTQVVYFHTDEIDREGKRSNPVFLPEWSPDTLASSFYFGECFAVRAGAFQKATQDLEEIFPTADDRDFLYAAVLLLTAQEPAALMDVVMYHRVTESIRRGSPQNRESGFLLDRIWRILSGASGESGKPIDRARLGRWAAYAERNKVCREAHRISILIPSKDHPDILRRCVESIRQNSGDGTALTYEVIVVDNGSTTENRKQYENCAEELGFCYEYVPMEFNFSKMCNLAAGLADGDYYLFLNDDMEVLSGDWLVKMLELAALPHVGAVGAKLLYPDTTLIQHAGITNMYEGPAHKLLKYDDRAEYYDGRNRGVWDVIGVTAACLMISKEKFDRAGGFAGELKVAYNDVDLCFRFHQKGWFNVVRNDLILYHHESLSRGDDHLDPVKRRRLADERKTLYRRNPEYYDYDPFYSRHLTGASEAYECTLPYENRNIPPVSGVKKLSAGAAGKYPGAAMNETLIIRVDAAGRELFARQGESPAYLVDLHAHVRGLDSCDYRYRMVLKGRRGCYEIPATRRFRPDVEKTMKDETHVELSGFAARIPEKMLPPDIYEIWMEAKCAYSRQRLCNKAEQTLTVSDTDISHI